MTRALTAASVAAVVLAPPAWGQTTQPGGSPTPVPSVTGEVSGALQPGGALTIRVDAVMPGGWDALHLVEAVVVIDGREVERLTYDIEDIKLSVGEHDVVVGTGAVATGNLLRVRGSRVVVTTGAGNLAFTVTAEVLRPISKDARFELSVTGDRGETASVTRRIAEPESQGLTWGSVVAAIVLALFSGGFVGNLYASHRRPPPRLSVYGTIQRRLETERSTAGERRG